MSNSSLEPTTILTPTTCFTIACVAFSLVALSTVWRNSSDGCQVSATNSNPPEDVARPRQQRRKAVDDLFAEAPEDNGRKPRQKASAHNQQSQIGELVSRCASIAKLLLQQNYDTRSASTNVDLLNDLSLLTSSLCRAQQRIFDMSNGDPQEAFCWPAMIGALEATLVLIEASIYSGTCSTDVISNAAHNIREQTKVLDSFLESAGTACEPPTPPPEVVVEACLGDARSHANRFRPTSLFDSRTGITPGIDDKCWIEPPPEYSPPARRGSNNRSEQSDRKVEVHLPRAQSPQREDKPFDSSALYDAVNTNDSLALESLLTRGADLSTKFGDLQRTALHQAAHLNRCMCIASLVKHGAIMSIEDAKGDTALHLAAWAGNVEALAILLDHGAEVDWLGRDGYSPLWCAISARHIDAARLLLRHGARVSLRSASGGGLTPLHQAAVTGQGAMVELLLDRGAQADCVDDDRNTPLHYAAASGSVPSVKVLLREGAIVEAVQVHGLTAVHWASHKGHAEVLKTLLDHGARLDRRAEDGATPLHLAANRGHVDVVRLLLERGAMKDVNSAAWDGVSGTPAAMAKAKGHKQVAKLLRI